MVVVVVCVVVVFLVVVVIGFEVAFVAPLMNCFVVAAVGVAAQVGVAYCRIVGSRCKSARGGASGEIVMVVCSDSARQCTAQPTSP